MIERDKPVKFRTGRRGSSIALMPLAFLAEIRIVPLRDSFGYSNGGLEAGTSKWPEWQSGSAGETRSA